MTPDERQLITGLFERMRGFGAPEKDREAEALINQQIRALPDATYMLVQSVLVQEQALQNAQSRIQDLEGRLADVQGAEPRKSGSFLGGFWGQRRDEARPPSVPQVGSRASSAAPPQPDTRQPWSQPAPPPPQPAAGGGFMRSALTTAAGVAGGMLLADSLRGMFGGAHASSPLGSGSPFGAQSDASQSARDAADDAADDQRDADAADDAADDQRDADASDDAADDAGDDGDYGGDDSGGDMDV